jgi:D-alanyl-D-alanine carboxypeptidase
MPAPNDSFLAALASKAAGTPLMPREQPDRYEDLVANASGGGDYFQQMMGLSELVNGQNGGGGYGAPGAYQFGNAFNPNQDLVTRGGVTLQRSALSSLMQNPRLGRRILGSIGGGYRDLQAQQAAYNAYQNGTGNLAAKPGHSYHNYGLAFDLSQHLGPKLQNYLERLGWRNEVPGEWWHWSIGNAPWGGN